MKLAAVEDVVPSDEVITRETVFVHIGQAGVQLGSAIWELFGLEHGITATGEAVKALAAPSPPAADPGDGGTDASSDPPSAWALGPTPTSTANVGQSPASLGNWHSVYDNVDDRYVPRTVFIDLEPTVIDEIRTGAYKSLFNPNLLLTGKEDAAGNYARGYGTAGRSLEEVAEETLRKVAERCDSLQGAFFFHSLGGGTGSGFASRLMQRVRGDVMGKNPMIQFAVSPGPKMSHVTEPYNAILSTHATIDVTDCCVIFDNEALYDISSHRLGIEHPTQSNLNRMVAQVVSSVLSSVRFGGQLHVDLLGLETNLVPYPRLHFMHASYAPLMARYLAGYVKHQVDELSRACFEPHSQMLKCDPTRGTFMSCFMVYRGDVHHNQVTRALEAIRRKAQFRTVDWCPALFKVSLADQPPIVVPDEIIAPSSRSTCMLANSTNVVQAWHSLGHKFDLMFHKRAFVHHFVAEGLEEDEFVEARENIDQLQKDYTEAASSEREEDVESDDEM